MQEVLKLLNTFVTDVPMHSVRETPGGRHRAMTIEPTIEEAEHVLEIYERLKEIDGVVMLL